MSLCLACGGCRLHRPSAYGVGLPLVSGSLQMSHCSAWVILLSRGGCRPSPHTVPQMDGLN